MATATDECGAAFPPVVFDDWENSGCELAKEKCLASSPDVGNIKDGLGMLLRELIVAVVRGSPNPELMADFFSSDELQEIPDIQVLIADVISFVDMDIDFVVDLKDHRLNLIKFVVALKEKKAVPDVLLKERLDPGTLHEAKIIASVDDFNGQVVKRRTKIFYKQTKFNLMREETEGYAKLVTELNQDFKANPVSPEVLVQRVQSLVGYFELDPNRVMDIVLEAFENTVPFTEPFLSLLRTFTTGPTALCNLLGFKFQKTRSAAPESLYQLTAILIKNDLVPLGAIYPHLSPTDQSLKESSHSELSEALNGITKTSVSLNATGQTEEEKAATLEKKVTDAEKNVKTNQKLGVCSALLDLKDWTNAKLIIDRLPKYYAVSHPKLCIRLIRLCSIYIEPLYRKIAPPIAKQSKFLQQLMKHTQHLKSCETYEDLPWEMLHAIGIYLSTNLMLFTKVVRICRACLQESYDRHQTPLALSDEISKLLQYVLLPSISLLQPNPAVVEEVWGILKYFHYQERYRLYDYWKNESFKVHIDLINAHKETMQATKYIMQRLSKENLKKFGRQIGKLSHKNPGLLFGNILSKIQVYDNFIGPVVDSLKYLTNLAFDVLAFCIVEALANPQKNRIKYEDINLSAWLRGLAVFSGTIFRKYAIELNGLLQYVANKLKSEESFDLLVLKELIQKMAGMETAEDATDAQLKALSGGPTLRSEAGSFQVESHSKVRRKSTQRLKDTLIERKLALPLLILIAQQRNCLVFKESSKQKMHLKLAGKLYDEIQTTLILFLRFLKKHVAVAVYADLMPDIKTLHDTYHLEHDVAFHMIRPALVHRRTVEMDKLTAQGSGVQMFIKATNTALSGVIEQVKSLFPASTWDFISPNLIVAFWFLSLYDIDVPKDSYEATIQKQKDMKVAHERDHTLSSSKRKRELERCETTIRKLEDEKRTQLENHRCVLAWLKQDKDKWFLQSIADGFNLFLQYCVFPRVLFSANDAIYCAKFMGLMHRLKTANFSIGYCCQRFIAGDTIPILTSCTENEAGRYGRFVSELLLMSSVWQQDKAAFAKECFGTPGFQQSAKANGPDSSFELYRTLWVRWNYALAKNVINLMSSGEFNMIRNSFIVLNKLLPSYPKIKRIGVTLKKKIAEVQEKEAAGGRRDLQAVCAAYLGQLSRFEKDWMIVSEFCIEDEEAKKRRMLEAKAAKENSVEQSAEKEKPAEKEKSAKKEKSVEKDKSAAKSTEKSRTTNSTKSSSKSTSTPSGKIKESSKSSSSSSSSSSSKMKESGTSRNATEDGGGSKSESTGSDSQRIKKRSRSDSSIKDKDKKIKVEAKADKEKDKEKSEKKRKREEEDKKQQDKKSQDKGRKESTSSSSTPKASKHENKSRSSKQGKGDSSSQGKVKGTPQGKEKGKDSGSKTPKDSSHTPKHEGKKGRRSKK